MVRLDAQAHLSVTTSHDSSSHGNDLLHAGIALSSVKFYQATSAGSSPTLQFFQFP